MSEITDKELAEIIEKLKEESDYEPAWLYDEDECFELGCTKPAVGTFYYWCGDPECCAPP